MKLTEKLQVKKISWHCPLERGLTFRPKERVSSKIGQVAPYEECSILFHNEFLNVQMVLTGFFIIKFLLHHHQKQKTFLPVNCLLRRYKWTVHMRCAYISMQQTHTFILITWNYRQETGILDFWRHIFTDILYFLQKLDWLCYLFYVENCLELEIINERATWVSWGCLKSNMWYSGITPAYRR